MNLPGLTNTTVADIFTGGGNAGDRLRTANWTATSLGTPEKWPLLLRSALGILLPAPVPMVLFWSSDRTCFYNDAAAPFLLLDTNALTEIRWNGRWSALESVIETVFDTGYPVSKALVLPVPVGTGSEDAHWTVSGTPVLDEARKVCGVFVTCAQVPGARINQPPVEGGEALQAVAAEFARERQDLSELINQVNAGIVQVNAQGRFVAANNRFCQMIGYTSEELLQRTATDVTHPDDIPKTREVIELCIREGKSALIEKRYLRRDGSVLWVSISVSVVSNAGEKVVSAVSFDISDQVLARVQMREQEDRLRIAMDGGELGTYDFYPDTSEVVWSDKTKAFFGLSKDAPVTFETLTDAIHPDDRDRVLTTIKSEISNGVGAVYEQEYRIISRADGRQRWIRSKGKVSFNSEGTAVRLMGIMQDITVAKQAFKSLQLQSQVLECMNEGVSVSDEAGKILYTNPAENQLFGYAPGELIDQNVSIQNAFSSTESQHIVDEVMTQLKESKSWSGEWHNKRKDGSTFYSHSFITALFIEEKTFFVRVQRDVTQEKSARDAIIASEQRYRNLLLQSPFAVCILKGPEMVINLANDAIKALWGKGDEVEGRPLLEVLPEFEEQGARSLLRNVYQTGTPYIGNEVLFSFTEQDVLRELYLNFVYQPYRESNDTISGVTCIAYEVTTQVLAKKKLEDSEEYFRQLTDTVPAIIWITNSDGYCTYLNKNWYAYTGQTLKEAEGFGWLNATHPDDKAGVEQLFLEANSKHQHFTAQYRLRNAKGAYRWAVDTGSPKFSPDGAFEGMIGTVVDVHEEKMADQMLEYRKALLEAHNEASLDGILLVDANGKILSYNKRFIELWHMPTTIVNAQDDAAALAFAMTQLVHPQQFIDKVEYLYKHPLESSVDELQFKDGKILQRLGYPVIGSDGTYYAWSWTFRDMTAQKQYEKTIVESEERFRTLADQSPMIVYILEPKEDASISYFNKTWLDYTGQTMEQALGRAWNGIVHPDDVEGVMRDYVLAFETRSAYILPAVRLLRHDGQYRWHCFRGNPRYLSTGEFIGFVGVGFDIHEQTVAEVALKQSEELFRTLAETLPQLVWMTDASGNLLYASSRWKDYSGITNIDSEPWLGILHPDDREAISRKWSESITTGKLYQTEARLKDHTGAYRWHSVQGEPICNEDGTIAKWIGAFTDMQSQKESEQKLEALVAQRTLDLERSNEDLQQFAHVASHDLKEPVRKIKTFSNRLHEEFHQHLPEKARGYIDKMETAANRMYTMIDGVLLYSSLAAVEQTKEPVDLETTLRHIEDDLEMLIVEKGASVVYKDLPVIQGSPILIYQLLYNLVNNALKFSSKSEMPFVRVTSGEVMRDGKNFVAVTVTDNGIGFDKAFAERIFKTFARLNSKDQYEGTGLGLSLCKKIAERHGGSITASSTEGKGASFEVLLPA